ncbi:MAG: TIGR00730 family Rossman fold protein [Phycisphaerales bacterium]
MTPPPPPSSHPEPNRPELDPQITDAAINAPGTVPATPASTSGGVWPQTVTGTPPPPEDRAVKRADAPDVLARIDTLISEVAPGTTPDSMKGRLVKDLIVNALKLIPDERDTGEIKLITAAVKELRYAYRVFGQYPEPHKVTIFGSARTPKTHPDYAAAVEFGRLMAEQGWMSITGAGGGIMEAGHEGPGKEKSFGVAIRLPFETTANAVIAGDSKLITFRYFFTRKLMFVSQAEAVALFPGGFGTMDEAFESLTLVQTGKAAMLPVVLVQGKGETYWEQFITFVKEGLLTRGWISAEDLSLFKLCATPREAADHILKFYRVYHSARYVKDDLVIRTKRPLQQRDIDALSERFASLIKKPENGGTTGGRIIQRGPFDVETDHRDLPRLVFTHTRYHYGKIRQLIDAINECEPAN